MTSLRTNRTVAYFVGPTAVPGHGGDQSKRRRRHGRILGADSLGDPERPRFGAHADVTNATPYTNLPDAQVLVTSQLADGTTGLTSLLVGGNSSLPRDTRVSGGEFFNQTSWNSVSGAHHWRATVDGRLDHLFQNSGFDTRGSFQYNSIADLDANHAAAFSRAFVSHGIGADVQTGALALGDQWRRSIGCA